VECDYIIGNDSSLSLFNGFNLNAQAKGRLIRAVIGYILE